MRPFSLAAKLGLKVGLMSAALLLLFATFGYLMVGKALERNARADLEVKMAGMAHNLSTIPDISGVNADAHQLVDLVMGHNNLYVSIFDTSQNQTPCSRLARNRSIWRCTSFSRRPSPKSTNGVIRRTVLC